MSNQDFQNTGVIRQAIGGAADMHGVAEQRAHRSNRSGAGGTRAALNLSLVVALVCLLVVPSFAPSEAVTGSLPASALAAPGDEYWEEGFNVPGMNHRVSALALGPDGSLYVGGEFTTAGKASANHIARWDGSHWHALGSGVTGTTDPYVALSVLALAFAQDGSLYAGGHFTTAGGVAANHIARWDGIQWHPLGGGMGGSSIPYVNALAIGPDGSLYVGGKFSTAGGVSVNHIARWDGSQWYPLGDGMNDWVLALVVGPDGSLYAGGRFTTAGGVTASGIARWDGIQWHALGSGVGGISEPYVLGLTIGPDGSLYSGGNFTTAGGIAANYIARWDGDQWHSLGSGMDSTVHDLAFGPDGFVYAGGEVTTAGGSEANLARWDGTNWHVVGRFNFGVSAITFGLNGSLYAGGGFTTISGIAANHIARWDGTLWHPISPGNGMGSSVHALVQGADGSLYAGGTFTTAGEVATNYIARWDGTQWYALDSGMGGEYGQYVVALAVGLDGSLYAGGWFTTAGGVAANYIARWDGAQWHPLDSGMGGSSIPYVTAMAVGPDGSLYVGGKFSTAGGVSVNHIARWDGSQWYPLGDGMNDWVWALVVGPDGSLYAGGKFTMAGGIEANRIARWDGVQWHPLGSGLTSEVRVLVFDPNGTLYAGGDFWMAGGVAANRIARWDGNQWHPLGSGMSNPVHALAVGSNGSLYAGGEFTTAGGVSTNYIARWNGTWQPLGSGLTGRPYPWFTRAQALAVGPDDSLYAGGWFSSAGDKRSSNIAQWNGEAVRRSDFNGSGVVDIGDIMIVAALWNEPAGPPYDLDGDGVITVVDIQRVARWWGWSVP